MPDNYWALAWMVNLFRRVGRIQDAKEFIEKSERAADRKCDPGLQYVKGLFKWYNGDP